MAKLHKEALRKAKQSKAKQSKAKQNKSKSKAKQNKIKQKPLQYQKQKLPQSKGLKMIFQANRYTKDNRVAIAIFNRQTFNKNYTKELRKDTSYSPEEKSTKITCQF